MNPLAVRTLARPTRTLVAGFAVIAALIATGTVMGAHLSPTTLLVPGSDSSRATALYEQRFGSDSSDVAVLLTGPARVLDRRGPLVGRRLRRLREAAVTTPWDGGAGAGALRPRPGAALIVVSFPDRGRAQRMRMEIAIGRAARLGAGPGVRTALTGAGIIGRALERSALDAVARAELIALPALIVVLLLVFRTLIAALIPIVFGVTVVVSGHAAVALLARVADLDAFAVTLVSLVGLALGVDYSLLLVSRYREELRSGSAPYEAALRAAQHGGHTVAVASLALAAALSMALFIAPGGVLLSTVAGALTAAGLAAATALGLLPPLLVLLGRRIDALALGSRQQNRVRRGVAARLATLPLRPAVTVTLVGGALIALALPALTLRTGPPDVAQLPASNGVRQATETISRAAGAGFTSPFVLVAAGASQQFSTPAARHALGSRLGRVPGVRALAVQPSADASALRITVVGPGGPNDPRSRALHRRLQRHAAQLGHVAHATVAVGGQPAEFDDFRHALADRTPWLIAAMLLATALVLAAVFRSLVLPVVTLGLNLLAVGASFGAVRLLFNGSPPLLGGPGFVDAVSIIAAFAVVFALSIDYQVFITARIREHYRATGDAHAALAHGLGRTAAIVTGAAAIMIAVFVAFALAPTIAIRQLGTALAIAVALDATVVRLVLLPAIARLLGERLWSPPRLRRRPRLAPTPATQELRR